MEARFISPQKRGLINLPPDLKRRYALDEPGTQVEVSEGDGVIVLRPHNSVPANQRWFWTDRWQKMEREADQDIEAGHVARFDDIEDFLADLDDGE
jgi:hypothetical protein